MKYCKCLGGCLLGLAFLVPGHGSPRAQGIILGPAHQISKTSTVRYEMEWAHPDPTDARYIMICGMDEDQKANTVGGYLYASNDGGATWTRAVSDTSTNWVSEEHCAYGANGNAYFTTGESNTTTGNLQHSYGKFQLFVSHDHGMTWRKAARRGFIDWTFDTVLKPVRNEPERLVIFGNAAVTKSGHWSLNPVAFESTDGGISLRGPFAVASPPYFRYVGVFAFGTLMLSNETVIFSAASRHFPRGFSDSHFFLRTESAELFAYDPHAQTLRSFAMLNRGTSAWPSAWPVPIARDSSGGKFTGRLYVGWITGKHALLSVSDNNGRTWSSREILRATQTIAGLHLAVNTSGILAISWVKPGIGLYIATSRDGGKNFSPSIQIADYHNEFSAIYYPQYVEAVPVNEYSGALTEQAKRNSSFMRLEEPPGLGIAFRIQQLIYSDASDLVADANGVFHIFWSQPTVRQQVLWTRSFSITMQGVSTKSSIVVPAGSLPRAVPVTSIFPMRNPGFDATLLHWKNISHMLGIRLSNLNYNVRTHDVALDVQLINLGKRALQGHLALMATDIHSDLGDPQPRNAQRRFHGGATWDISTVIPPKGVQPWQSSLPFRLRFAIADFHAAQPQAILDAVAMGVKIYQKPS